MKLSNFLEVNVGKTDKIIRLILVISCLLTGFFTKNNWFFLGLLPLFSVVTGRCPLYSLLGFRTCPLKNSTQ
jgi:hypothetical protein